MGVGVGEGSSDLPTASAPLPPPLAQCAVLGPGSHHPVSPPVENLRQLILWSLLPGHPMDPQAAGEPEDDLTPTPSVISITSHPWDPGSPGRAPPGGEGDNAQLSGPERGQPGQEDVALRSLEHLPPRTRNSGIWESPDLDRNPEEEASSTEATGSYKVVRKGKMNWVVHWGDKHPSFASIAMSSRRSLSSPPLSWKPSWHRKQKGGSQVDTMQRLWGRTSEMQSPRSIT